MVFIIVFSIPGIRPVHVSRSVSFKVLLYSHFNFFGFYFNFYMFQNQNYLQEELFKGITKIYKYGPESLELIMDSTNKIEN